MSRITLFIITLLLIGIPAVLSIPRIVSSAVPEKEPPTRTILFVPGLWLQPEDYTVTLDHLRNQGYTILEYRPTFGNTADYPQTVNTWTDEAIQLAGDKKVIVMGHSTGGAVATHFCAISTKCVAGINLDGGPAFEENLTVPFLYLQADAGRYCDHGCGEERLRMEQMVKQSNGEIVHLPNMKHLNFTDDALKPSKGLRDLDYLGSVDGKDGLEKINKEITSFLNSL